MKLFYDKIENRSLKNCFKDGIRDLWTHSSTAIEGNTLTLGETAFALKEGLTISGKTIREHNEIIGHSNAMDILYNLIINDSVLTKDIIFDLHTATMLNPTIDVYAPIGKWKTESNFTLLFNEQNEQIYKEYPKPEKTGALMEKWINLFALIENEDPLIQYSKLHILFGAIHPFADGNGRLARLLANIPILKAGLVPITISNKSRAKYIKLLQIIEIDENLNIINGLDKFVIFAKEEWNESLKLYNQAKIKDGEAK